MKLLNVKETADLLSFLTKAKEDKRFYTKHKRHIDKLLRVINTEFESIDAKQTSKLSFKTLREYIPLIAELCKYYFNSS